MAPRAAHARSLSLKLPFLRTGPPHPAALADPWAEWLGEMLRLLPARRLQAVWVACTGSPPRELLGWLPSLGGVTSLALECPQAARLGDSSALRVLSSLAPLQARFHPAPCTLSLKK